MSITTPSKQTLDLFYWNRLAAYKGYVREKEVVPHFFSRGSYYMTRNAIGDVIAVSNSCLHRGYKLVTERTFKKDDKIVCPMHGKCYTIEGQSEFEQLPKPSLKNIENFYFEQNSLPVKFKSGISGLSWLFELAGVTSNNFKFEHENLTFYQVNWKTIIELMMDDEQINFRHPGFGAYVSKNPNIFNGIDYSLCRYFICDIYQGNTASHAWQHFRHEVDRIGWKDLHGYSILNIFPGLTVELFPYTMVISQVVPLHDKLTTHYTQVYFSNEVEEDYQFKDSFADAYNEKAQQRGIFQDFLQDGRDNYNTNNYNINQLKTLSKESPISNLENWIIKNSKFNYLENI